MVKRLQPKSEQSDSSQEAGEEPRSSPSQKRIPRDGEYQAPNRTLSEESLKLDLIEHCPFPVLRVSAEGVLLYANPGSAPILRAWEVEENQVLPRDWMKQIRSTLHSNRERQVELEADRFIFKLVLVPLQEQRQVQIYGHDVTVEKTVEELLRSEQARSSYVGKLAALGEMAGGVAHEINNPLAIIKASSEQLIDLIGLERGNSDRAKVLASKIDSTSQRIASIVRGLRYFSRDGRSDPFEQVAISDVIQDTLSLCVEKFRYYGVKFTMPKDPPQVVVPCQPTQISQVLLNLLNNAFDAIAELPEKDRWIHLEMQVEDKGVKILVSNSGPRISREIEEKIFQPFFSTKEVGKGTGLGLSISKGIIDLHSGKLEVSADSKVTCFVITLPTTEASSSAA